MDPQFWKLQDKKSSSGASIYKYIGDCPILIYMLATVDQPSRSPGGQRLLGMDKDNNLYELSDEELIVWVD